jgi:hypothetical protein
MLINSAIMTASARANRSTAALRMIRSSLTSAASSTSVMRPARTAPVRDGLARTNVHSICIKVPISMLQKDGHPVSMAANILDPEFVIGVWASASRQSHAHAGPHDRYGYTESGAWVQVSRLGMPLTNEAVIARGNKDLWNSLTPYQDLANIATFGNYFYNPELALVHG